MPCDYSDAPPPRGFDPIPPGTTVIVVVRVRPGGVEYTVVSGPYARRCFTLGQP